MGRTQDPDLDAAIGTATLELLGEIGFDRLSIAAVATRAGTARTSIYRRWPDKTSLVMAAIREALTGPDGIDDTGTLRGDLIVHARALANRLEPGILAGLLTALRDNADLGTLVRASIVARDQKIMVAVISAAPSPAANYAQTPPRTTWSRRSLCR
ncbi:TetR/AcrR family transcriptional regulator [Fodinicola feengrottensis]|uniref:TetR/AcrR family transcriptional regulator n=1 Tax=Fodinicola feengrottensis TaxID=435914 RepID=UPI0013D3BFCE|nr:TetR/AcrR family transcriptional regulator [Fodinicola feengrottensis]